MNIVILPDGDNSPFYVNADEIIAFRAEVNDRTLILFKGDQDGLYIKCPVDEIVRRLAELKESE